MALSNQLKNAISLLLNTLLCRGDHQQCYDKNQNKNNIILI